MFRKIQVFLNYNVSTVFTDISICSISNFLEMLMSIVGMEPGDTVNFHEEDFSDYIQRKIIIKNNLY